jgi:hypothetical protein
VSGEEIYRTDFLIKVRIYTLYTGYIKQFKTDSISDNKGYIRDFTSKEKHSNAYILNRVLKNVNIPTI